MTQPHSTITPALVSALDATWAAIRKRHPDVPEVVITLGAGTARGSRFLKYGHFAAARWQRGDGRIAELFIGGEGLERGAVATLGTLLHEACHGVAMTREVQDTSRQGRWHNEKFRQIAQELGITVAKVAQLGWSDTTVPDETAALYAAQVKRLERAMVAFRHSETGIRATTPGGPTGPTGGEPGGKSDPGRKSSNNPLALTCGCPRKIRASAAVIALGPITCGVCGEAFKTAEQRAEDEDEAQLAA